MHKLTEIEIGQKRKQYSKERDDEWNRIVRSASAAGNLLSGNTIIQFIKTGFRYIDIILNSAYSVETGALLKSKILQPDAYFMDFKDKLFQITEEESGIVRSKALAQFRTMGEGIQREIVAQAGRETADLRESILGHVERIKEQVKLDLSQETAIKKDPLVFISYDTRDIELSHAVAAIIKRIFTDRIRTFIAKRDIKAGDNAFKTMLHDSLAKSAIVLAICTKQSLTSPWLWFESGAGFGTGTLIPIWVGVKPEEFKAPLTIFQGKSVDDKTEMEELITRIAEVTKVTCPDYSLTAEELAGLKQLTEKLNSISEEGALKGVADEISNSEITKLYETIASLKNEMRRADLKASLAQFNKRVKKQITLNDKQLDILRFIQNHERISEIELIERFDDGNRLIARHDIDELARLKFIKINRVDGVITDAAGRAYLVNKLNPSKTSD
jgi:hypothetical protein